MVPNADFTLESLGDLFLKKQCLPLEIRIWLVLGGAEASLGDSNM